MLSLPAVFSFIECRQVYGKSGGGFILSEPRASGGGGEGRGGANWTLHSAMLSAAMRFPLTWLYKIAGLCFTIAGILNAKHWPYAANDLYALG